MEHALTKKWNGNIWNNKIFIILVVFFLTRPISVNIFFRRGYCRYRSNSFCIWKSKKFGRSPRCPFLNFRPEVSEKNSRKKIFDEKSIFPRFQKFFWGTSGLKFEKRAPWPPLNLVALSTAKRIRALAAIQKNLKNQTGRVKKKWPKRERDS